MPRILGYREEISCLVSLAAMMDLGLKMDDLANDDLAIDHPNHNPAANFVSVGATGKVTGSFTWLLFLISAKQKLP